MRHSNPKTEDVAPGLVGIEWHAGSRAGLRSLFELAEDSAIQLDSYLDAGRVLVAVSGDQVLGYLQVTDTARADVSEVKSMAVLPAHRRRGIGRALITAAIELARQESRSTVLVATATADVDNLRFYQRLGFRMRSIDRDAFTPSTGYDANVDVDGIELRDRVWLDLPVQTAERERGARRRNATVSGDRDLYVRGAATLVASWEEYARGAEDAAVERLPGVAAAVFPNEPERTVYNNALLERDLPAAERGEALDAMAAAYAAAGVTRFAAWVHEADEPMRADLARRGYTIDASTRAMGMALEDFRLPRPGIEVGSGNLLEHLRILGVPPDLLSGADPSAFHVLIARLEGDDVATALAFDLAGDCGIYNVTTLEHARRRGLGTALTALQLHCALARGCRTASLQSTAIAEGIYRAVGFRDLGRIFEYVP